MINTRQPYEHIYLPMQEPYEGESDELRISEWMPYKGWYFTKQELTDGYKLRQAHKRVDNFSSLVWDGNRIFNNTGRHTVILVDSTDKTIALFYTEDKNETES